MPYSHKMLAHVWEITQGVILPGEVDISKAGKDHKGVWEALQSLLERVSPKISSLQIFTVIKVVSQMSILLAFGSISASRG